MKITFTVTKPTQFPKFWEEEWLKIAIDELDSRKMTPDEKASLEMLMARNAEAVSKERRKSRKAVSNLLALNLLTVEQIAVSLDTSVEFVLSVQQRITAE